MEKQPLNDFTKAQAIIDKAFPANKSRFMEPEITKYQKWAELAGPAGVTWIPLDCFNGPLDNTGEHCTESGVHESGMYEFGIVEGYGARMSAPGYTDCTEWTVFESPEEAAEYLAETLGEESEDDDEEPDEETLRESLVTEDHKEYYYDGKLAFTVEPASERECSVCYEDEDGTIAECSKHADAYETLEEAYKDWCKNYFPSVYFLSDHGNISPIILNETLCD